MSFDTPNRLHFSSGETSFAASFGNIRTVSAVHFPGPGHTPHVEARFCGGTRLDLTPAATVLLIRELQQALAQLPHYWTETHDAVGGIDG